MSSVDTPSYLLKISCSSDPRLKLTHLCTHVLCSLLIALNSGISNIISCTGIDQAKA